MAGEERGPGIKQILVALDASAHGRAALKAAARLARSLGAELVGVYVEDADVLGLPRVSFLRETDALSGEERSIRREDLERRLRLEVTRLRRAMEEAAGESEVKWSFRVTRGRVVASLLEAARSADLVSLGARSHWMGRDPGSTTRAVVTRAGKPVMVLRKGATLGDRVCVLFDGSEPARKSLAQAAGLSALRKDTDLFVVLHGPSGATRQLRTEATSVLEEAGVGEEPSFSILMTPEPEEILDHLCSIGCGLVVISRDRFTDSEARLRRILGRVGCPLLLTG